jgi:hypothetical protein
MARVIHSPEELEAAIEEDELEDAHEAALAGVAKMSVREYARYKHIQPQLVYYYIRTGKIKEAPCICGRKVIDVASADAFFRERDEKRSR